MWLSRILRRRDMCFEVYYFLKDVLHCFMSADMEVGAGRQKLFHCSGSREVTRAAGGSGGALFGGLVGVLGARSASTFLAPASVNSEDKFNMQQTGFAKFAEKISFNNEGLRAVATNLLGGVLGLGRSSLLDIDYGAKWDHLGIFCNAAGVWEPR